MTAPDLPTPPAVDENSLIAERREKLAAIRSRGIAFPNDFKPKHRAAELARKYGHLDNEVLEPQAVAVSVAGRLMLKRVMGKASFATLQDASGRIQLRVSVDAIGEADYGFFKHFDLGDIVGAEGRCSRPRPASSPSRSRSCACSPRACARCPTSSTAWPTPRTSTASATST